jgi:hypothetical protein
MRTPLFDVVYMGICQGVSTWAQWAMCVLRAFSAAFPSSRHCKDVCGRRCDAGYDKSKLSLTCQFVEGMLIA